MPVPSSFEGTLIVMPAFQEEASVADVVHEVFAKLPGVSVLVVDDGSSDATTEVARAAGARVATLPYNLGVGGAMRVGFKYALENGYDSVVQVDSDGQHDPAGVPALLAQLATHDLVLGARFAGEGDYTTSGPRAWAMKVLAAILSRTAKAKLTDTTSGFKASGPRAVALFAEHYPAEYLGDTIDSLVAAIHEGLTVAQVPVAMRPRLYGRPSQGFMGSAIYLLRSMFALTLALMRRPRRGSLEEVTA